uniref:Uncharacterized protein n=1 Tax=Ditylenchus dipsaci TaxID=166011 RepID=A0A915D278_9BILA
MNVSNEAREPMDGKPVPSSKNMYKALLSRYPASELLKFGVCSEKSLEDKARQYYRQKVSDDEKMKNLQERMKTEMLTRMKMRMKTRKDT